MCFAGSVSTIKYCLICVHKVTRSARPEMPYRILCNGTEQKSLEARAGLTLKPSHFSPLHKIRYGVQVHSGLGLHKGSIGIGGAYLQVSLALITATFDAAILCSPLCNPVMTLGIELG